MVRRAVEAEEEVEAEVEVEGEDGLEVGEEED